MSKKAKSGKAGTGAGALYLERQGPKRFAGAEPAGPRQPAMT